MFTLSWDLFIVVVFAVVIAYSFIIGRDSTMKVIIGTYIAILASDGLGNLFSDYLLGSGPFLQFLRLLSITNESQAVALFKIVMFIIAVVVIAMKGGFYVEVAKGRGGVPGLIMSLVFGFLSAGLVVATLFIYVSGASFFEGNVNISNATIQSIYSQSQLTRAVIDNYSLWFSLPAITFVITSFFRNSEEGNPQG